MRHWKLQRAVTANEQQPGRTAAIIGRAGRFESANRARAAGWTAVPSCNSLALLNWYRVIGRSGGQLEHIGDGALTYVNTTIAGNVN